MFYSFCIATGYRITENDVECNAKDYASFLPPLPWGVTKTKRERRRCMKTTMFLLVAAAVLSGCEVFRLPATEAQKENAWLHRQTTQLAAKQAQKEDASPELQGLTALAHQQSMAFVIDAGLPR